MARFGTIRIKIGDDGWGPLPQPRPTTDPVLAAELGARLCRVLGLTAERTRRITIELEAGHVASVTVDQYITAGQADDLVEESTRYGLHRADPAPQLSPGFTILGCGSGDPLPPGRPIDPPTD